MSPKPYYITTAIDYPNGAPHLGHLYEKVVADTYARWYRYLGYEVAFVTGTDENGQKLLKAAQAEGANDTKSYIDANVLKFQQLCRDIHLTHTDFIRTTESRHWNVAQTLWQTLEREDHIYFDRYSGHYCLSCEAFYSESQAEELKCPTHGTPLEYMEEDGYFFRLSRFQDWIVSHIEANEAFIFPKSARREVLSRLKGDKLRDLSISRPNAGWGIPVPGNDKHVMYTWFDALINYYAASEHSSLGKPLWPADMHVIGKDITWFHTVIWPVMLHASGIELPRQVHVHGMLLAADGRKMSKSLGNSVEPYDLLGAYPTDLIRYYLLRAIPSGGDGAFSENDMINRNNSELANDFGNLALRVIKLAQKRIGTSVDSNNVKADLTISDLGIRVAQAMSACEHHRALDIIWECINQLNGYLNKHEPWRNKDDAELFKQHMYNALYGVHCCASLLQTFIPDASTKTLNMLGVEACSYDDLSFGKYTYLFSEQSSLFPKLEPKNDS